MARIPDSLWWGDTRRSIWKYQLLTLQHQYYWIGDNVGMQSDKKWQGNNKRNCFCLKETNGGSTFGGCSCGGPYTDGIPCHHMVTVVKSSRIEDLTSTNSMPVWWTTDNQYPAGTNETCRFDMATLRSTPEDAAMRYCPPYAAPRKAGRPKNNKCMKSPLEGMKKRKSTGSTREAMVDGNEGGEEEEGDTAPARYPKRARSRSQLWMGIFWWC